MGGNHYNMFGTGSNQRGSYGGGGEFAERQAGIIAHEAQNLYENNFNNQHGSSSHQQAMRGMTAEHRRVAAAQSMDIVQQYDAFGNNTYSTADNPWAAFFGAPTAPWKTTSYDLYDRHNLNLPDAYAGKSISMAATVDELIYSDENYYTSVLLPMTFTDDLHIEWDRWEFNDHFTGIVPEQGVSRLVSSHREHRSDSFIRRGLAAIFEHGFMSTPEGRANYTLTMAQIARACQETIRFGVIYAYLTCGNYTKQWQEKHGYFKKDTLKQLLQRQSFMWAIVVKSEFGMEKLDAQIVEWMNAHRSSADTWLLPPKPAMYLRLVPAEKTHYYLAGPEGPNRVNNIVGAGRPHEANSPNKRTQDIVEPYAVFKKNQVFLTRCYHVAKTGPIDLMMRTSALGEYFKILPVVNSFDYRNEYHTNYLDTRIYDEDNDTGATISPKEALRHCQVFRPDGTPNDLGNLIDTPDANDLRQCFFLRPVVNAEGIEQFKPISVLGDIDASFFHPEDAANWAATATRSIFPEKSERDELAKKLSKGILEVQRRNKLPLGAGAKPEAGKTSWADINDAAAPQEFKDLAEAIEAITTRLALVVGNQENIFLNPKNVIGGGPNGTPSQVLYENFVNGGTVPIFSVTGGTAGVGADSALFAEAHGLLVASIAQPGDVATTIRPAVVALQARVTGGGDLATANRKNTMDLLDILDATPTYSTDPENWRGWSNQMRARLEAGSSRLPTGTTATINRNSVPAGFTNRNNVSLRDGTAAANNIFPASRWNSSKPSDSATYGGAELLGGFMESPIASAMIGAEMMGARNNNNNDFDDYSSSYSSRGGGGGNDLHEMFDQEADIGSMFGGGETLTRNLNRLDANRQWIPVMGSGFELGGDETFNVRFGNLARNLDAIAKVPMDPISRFVVSLYYGAPWHRDTLDNFLDHNILCPVGFLGFRVGLYEMALGIKCKAGAETGRTYFGHSSFELGDDAAVGVHYGNFHHYGKSIVHDESKVFVAFDIAPNAIIGGMGVRPYTSTDQYDPSRDILEADIFYVMIPYREEKFDSVISMAGRFYTYMDRGMLDDVDPANRPLHYSTAAFYNRIWKWYSEENVQVELDEPMYRMVNAAQDLTVWQGAQGTYNPKTTKFDKNIIRNKSPWGPNVAEGCRASRDGQMERVPVVPYGVLGF